MQWFRGGLVDKAHRLVLKAHRLFVSPYSRRESNIEEEEGQSTGEIIIKTFRPHRDGNLVRAGSAQGTPHIPINPHDTIKSTNLRSQIHLDRPPQ